MLDLHGLVLVYAQCPQFFLSVQAALARENISVLQVDSRELMVRIIREEGPVVALIDWDSVGNSTLHLTSFLKSGPLKRLAQIAVVTKSGDEAPSRLAILASGADDFIDMSVDSNALLSQVRALLRWHPQPAPATIAHAL